MSAVKKKSIKPEPATSEEEGGGVGDTKPVVTEENDVDAKPPPGESVFPFFFIACLQSVK